MKHLFLIMGLCLSVSVRASVSVNVNGSAYTIPQTNERGWGTAVTSWIQAISANTLQPVGGTFTLTNDVDFGANYGLKAPYFLSRSANPATTGMFRLANTDVVAFRNFANSGNLTMGVNSSDKLTFNGAQFISTADTIPIASGGTNNTAAYTAGSIIYSDGTKLTQDNSNLFYDATNKRLGIKTTPSAELHVLGSGVYENESVSSSGPQANFWKARNYAAVTNNDELGTNSFYGSGGSGLLLSASMGALVDGSVTSTSVPSRLEFYTTPVAGTSKQLALTIGSDKRATVAGGLTVSTLGTGIVKSNASGVFSSSAVGLATSDITGTLPVANGGTNNAALATTAGGVLYTDGTKVVNVGAGTSGQYLKSNGASAPAWQTVSGLNTAYIVVSDYKTSGTQGGTAVSATWTARNFNTLNDPSGIVVNSGSFTGTGGTNTNITLPAGTYLVRGFSPHYMPNRYAKVRLYNSTDSSVIATGQTIYNNNGTDKAVVDTIFTLAAQKTIQLQYWFSAAVGADDLGLQQSAGGDELYSQMTIIKL